MRKFLILGTDTAIGKTYFSGLLAAAYEKQRPGTTLYIKPFQTGITDRLQTRPISKKLNGYKQDLGAEADKDTVSSLVETLTGCPLASEQVRNLRTYPLAASPHLAAAHAERPLAKQEIERVGVELQRSIEQHDGGCVIIEGVGGVLVPLAEVISDNNHWELLTFADFIASLLVSEVTGGLELLLVVRAGLGTLNHTLLTLEALERRGLKVRAIFLNDHFLFHQSEATKNASTNTREMEVHEIILADNVRMLAKLTNVPVLRFHGMLPEAGLSWLLPA